MSFTFRMPSTTFPRFSLPRLPFARLPLSFAVVLLSSLGACSSVQGPYTWVGAYRDVPSTADPIIVVGDFVSVRVREDEKFSVRVRVRDDGKIALPLIEDIEVVNQTAAKVARRIEDRLKADRLFPTPHVSVIVDDQPSVSVVGLVSRPGTYPLTPGSGVVEALASAGSLTEFAHRDRIFVLRKAPQQQRIRFTYSGLTGKDQAAMTFRLRAGDVVVVE